MTNSFSDLAGTPTTVISLMLIFEVVFGITVLARAAVYLHHGKTKEAMMCIILCVVVPVIKVILRLMFAMMGDGPERI